MLDHYYTPRDLPLSPEQMIQSPLPMDVLPDFDVVGGGGGGSGGPIEKAAAPRAAVVDLSALSLDQIVHAFDCDSDSDSGSDDGYVSTLLRIQRAAIPLVPAPRKIAGTRRVARAVSSPHPARTAPTMDADMDVEAEGARSGRCSPEGEVFQSITAIPGLESTSFEELRLETYLQSLIATGTARPQPAFVPALVIPPAFSAPFCEWDKDAAKHDVEMKQAGPSHPPPVFRAASFPPSHTEVAWN